MFTKETPKEISGLYDVIEAAESRFRGAYAVEKKQRQGELRLVLCRPSGGELLYIGLRYDLWHRTGSPLWFGVRQDWNEEIVSRFRKFNNGSCFRYEEFFLRSAAYEAGTEGFTKAFLEMLDSQLQILTEKPS